MFKHISCCLERMISLGTGTIQSRVFSTQKSAQITELNWKNTYISAIIGVSVTAALSAVPAFIVIAAAIVARISTFGRHHKKILRDQQILCCSKKLSGLHNWVVADRTRTRSPTIQTRMIENSLRRAWKSAENRNTKVYQCNARGYHFLSVSLSLYLFSTLCPIVFDPL